MVKWEGGGGREYPTQDGPITEELISANKRRALIIRNEGENEAGALETGNVEDTRGGKMGEMNVETNEKGGVGRDSAALLEKSRTISRAGKKIGSHRTFRTNQRNNNIR